MGLISRLYKGKKVVGFKQTRKAVCRSDTEAVFLAEDADPELTGALEQLCLERKVPVERLASMKELGALCGISVGASAAALLKEET